MAQDDELLDRLEGALDRIAFRVERGNPALPEATARLDAMIARLRAALEE